MKKREVINNVSRETFIKVLCTFVVFISIIIAKENDYAKILYKKARIYS